MSNKITCRGVDVTEHVAEMFDALFESLGWGSGFLDVETIESVLIVAELAGFDVPSIEVDLPGLELPPLPQMPSDVQMPHGGWPSDRPEVWEEAQRKLAEFRAAQNEAHVEHQRLKAEAIAAWRAQIKAKAQAMMQDAATDQERAP